MHSISVKELRQKFPFIRSELKKGTSFLVIYKSKPIAELKPMSVNNTYDYRSDEASDEEIEKAMLKDIDDDDYLSAEDVKYYLALPPLKS